MYKIGLSSCGKVLNEQLFADYAKAGIGAMEISPNWPDYKYLNYKELAAWSKKYGVEIWSYHLPFQSVDLSTGNRPWRLSATENISELIKQASDIGIHKFVAHASSGAIDPATRADRLAAAKDSLNTLAEFAAKYDSVVCVEDLPRRGLAYCSDELLDILSVNDKLRVCFDTNHLLEEDIPAFIRKVGDKIMTLHVSDYDFEDEKHWLPGEGDIQWDTLYKTLQEVGYDGVWMYELGFKSDFRSRELTPEDFVRNAKEIFASKPLTVIPKK